MARNPMGLTLADLEILRPLVDQQPSSHSAAAELVGLNRPRLSRLIQRVNEHIGEDLDWRASGRFRPPPEVRRLVARYSEFAEELDELGHAPLVSAGTSAMLLLVEVLGVLGRQFPRVSVVRSRDIWHALNSDEVDIAITHGSSVGLALGVHRKELKPGLLGHALLDWQSVLVKRTEGGRANGGGNFRPLWQPGSLGDQLYRTATQPVAAQKRSEAAIPCQSFLHAVELVRRGLICDAVVPDIYVTHPAVDFVLEPTELPVRDQLVAICRAEEQPRWAWLFERSVWERVAKRS